jgi:hypothetical protein
MLAGIDAAKSLTVTARIRNIEIKHDSRAREVASESRF